MVSQPHVLRPLWGEIDLDALAHNVERVQRWLRPGLALGASIKANAYGHGAPQVAGTLEHEGVAFVMTASYADALAIRAAGSNLKIVMLAAALPAAIPDYLRASLIPTVHSLEFAEAVSRHAERLTPVWVKVDAGLGRVGVEVEDAVPFLQRVVRLPNVVVDGIYTHLPFADAAGEAWARERLASFANAVAEARRLGLDVAVVQATSSPGTMTGVDARELTAVCVGSLLYGLPVLREPHDEQQGLRRVLYSIRARLIQVSRHGRDRRAGSGGTRKLSAGALTGLVPIGISDGYRPARGSTELAMLVGGTRVPVLGVTLAHTTVDLTDVADAAVGDEVVVLGSQGSAEITLDELASAAGAQVYEVALGFDGHIEYDYVHAGAAGRTPVRSPAPTLQGY